MAASACAESGWAWTGPRAARCAQARVAAMAAFSAMAARLALGRARSRAAAKAWSSGVPSGSKVTDTKATPTSPVAVTEAS
eukprot:8386691-Lingulodinium_polyedra.AAC.1